MPEAPWRVAIVTRILPVLLRFDATIRAAGHTPVAVVTFNDVEGRYGGDDIAPLLENVPAGLDVLLPGNRASLAPLLAALEVDLVVCMGFPWKIPPAALAVPRLGWLNGHPSLLPLYRGPMPIAWAIRNGERTIGITFHRMDEALDTGAIVAQRPFSLGDDYGEPDQTYERFGPLVAETLGEALGRLAAGEPGTVQSGGAYQSFFSDDDAWLDLTRRATEVHRLVWAWRYALPRGLYGALLELDGEVVRVLASSRTEVEDAPRIECCDGPLWLVRTEPVSGAAATRASARARTRR
ncbi:MAG: methionyl-tRNA formyltransferase [Gaiellaceae bacterium]